MVSDEVRDTYRLSQESMTRSQLDSRNSTERDPTFYEMISVKCNDDSWKPFTTAYPTLHSDFVSPILCERIDFVMTPEKAKEIVSLIRPMLKKMIINYEESGMGCMSKHDDSADWGNFDIELCDGNDDRSRFLLHPAQTYLLYWWAKLDEYNLISFTCGQISPHLTANTDYNPSIGSKRNTGTPKNSSKDSSILLNSNIAAVGQSMSDLVDVEVENQIAKLQNSKFELELKLCDMHEVRDKRVMSVIDSRIEQIELKITSMEERVNKKQKKSRLPP